MIELYIFMSIIPLFLMIYCLIDLMKKDFRRKQIEQILIFLLLIFLPFIGSIIYLLFLRKNYQPRNYQSQKFSI